MEDSPREDKHQYIKGEDRRGSRSVCKGGCMLAWGNTFPVQTNGEITGEVLIEVDDETMMNLFQG